MQPRSMSLPLLLHEQFHRLRLFRGKEATVGQEACAYTAPFVSLAVNHCFAKRAALLAEWNSQAGEQ
jgi:hypothetical protein